MVVILQYRHTCAHSCPMSGATIQHETTVDTVTGAFEMPKLYCFWSRNELLPTLINGYPI